MQWIYFANAPSKKVKWSVLYLHDLVVPKIILEENLNSIQAMENIQKSLEVFNDEGFPKMAQILCQTFALQNSM